MYRKERTNKMETYGTPDSSPDTREHATENQEPASGRTSPVEHQEVSRRTLLKGGECLGRADDAFASQIGEEDGNEDSHNTEQSLAEPGEEVIPWLDQPAENPFPDNLKNLLKWEKLDSWRIPTEDFFSFNHFGQPDGINEATWRLGIAGLVARPQSLTLAHLKTCPRREVDFCACPLGAGANFPLSFKNQGDCIQFVNTRR